MSDMLPRPEPRDAFKKALRAQLMAQAPGVLARRETSWSRFQGALLRPALALGVILAILLATTGKAAADSLPGDAAYPLKRAAEQVQLALALDETTKLRILAQQADHRLAELAASIASHRPATGIAQHEYAGAIAQLTKEVDTVRGQHGVSEDKKNEAEDIIDGVRVKHETVLQQLEQQGNADDHQDIEQAKEESQKLHPSDRPRTAEPSRQPGQSGRPEQSAQPGQSGQPDHTGSPQPGTTESPAHTPEASGSSESDGGNNGDTNKDNHADPTRPPQPTRTPGSEGGRAVTPTPSVRH